MCLFLFSFCPTPLYLILVKVEGKGSPPQVFLFVT